MTFEKIEDHIVEDWLGHAGTSHLLRILNDEHQIWLGALERAASNDEPVGALGGRCAMLRQLIREIRDAKGSPPRGEKE